MGGGGGGEEAVFSKFEFGQILFTLSDRRQKELNVTPALNILRTLIARPVNICQEAKLSKCSMINPIFIYFEEHIVSVLFFFPLFFIVTIRVTH